MATIWHVPHEPWAGAPAVLGLCFRLLPGQLPILLFGGDNLSDGCTASLAMSSSRASQILTSCA
jgi:hypothetical protein